MRALKRQRPKLLIGSPMCTYFSTMLNMNAGRMDPARLEQEKARAVDHMEFMCKLYRQQIQLGGYILHEHP